MPKEYSTMAIAKSQTVKKKPTKANAVSKKPAAAQLKDDESGDEKDEEVGEDEEEKEEVGEGGVEEEEEEDSGLITDGKQKKQKQFDVAAFTTDVKAAMKKHRVDPDVVADLNQK